MSIDDPTSQAPVGAKTFDPDVDTTVANGDEAAVLLANPARFIDADGNIVLTWSATDALITYQIYEI